jgi:L,D-peptidoglycan transpeptidase YkuD (ErfK/YbiS/YcfS/YnhG family)
MAIAATLAWVAVLACGCDHDKPAHASAAPGAIPPSQAEGLGFCTEHAPAPSASASSCTCEAPAPPPRPDAGASLDKSTVIPHDSKQLLLVSTPDWQAFKGQAQRYERDAGGAWRAAGASLGVAIGRRGMAWGRGLHPEGQPGPSKREGDTKSPAGVFELAGAYGYAAAPPAGATWPYRRLTVGWKCVDDPRNEAYNTMILPDGPVSEAPIGASWDGTRRDVIFNMFVEVRQNAAPVLPSAGSCVLLHRWVNPVTPTQGCTSFSKDSVETVLAWLSPAAHPVLVQLPEGEHRRLAAEWGLPR